MPNGGVLFDDAIRDAVVGNSASGRETAAQISNWFYFGSLAYPLLIDNLLVMLAIRRSPDVAGQMFWINLQSFAIPGFLSLAGTRFVGRSRPVVEGCRDQGDDYGSCTGAERFRSFPSGHTAVVFAGAGLSCNHHLALELYGERWSAYLMCALWYRRGHDHRGHPSGGRPTLVD